MLILYYIIKKCKENSFPNSRFDLFDLFIECCRLDFSESTGGRLCVFAYVDFPAQIFYSSHGPELSSGLYWGETNSVFSLFGTNKCSSELDIRI